MSQMPPSRKAKEKVKRVSKVLESLVVLHAQLTVDDLAGDLAREPFQSV